MPYSREELDWIEAEWAFHLHGRSAFLSREDFLQAQTWAEAGVPADLVVAAMGSYFERRAKRPKARGFVALAHLDKDVAKALRFQGALKRAGADRTELGAWSAVAEPLRSQAPAQAAFAAWQALKAAAPDPDNPGFLDHFDAERKAFRSLVALAEAALGARGEALRSEQVLRLREGGLEEGSLVWQRAWGHHWAQAVCDAWGIPR